MKACVYDRFGGPEVLQVREVPKPPSPEPGFLLVKVFAASLNPADFKTRDGEQRLLLGFDWPRVIGFDFSGEIVEIGSPEKSSFKVGDSVFAMIRTLPQANKGTCEEYLLVDEDICVHKPKNISHEEAASVPLVAITAIKAFRKCGLSEVPPETGSVGPRVLIIGGAGGVGTIAIQIAKSMFHASHVTTTASKGPKTDLVKSLGADVVVNYREEDFSKVLASNDESQLFDAVFDCMGEAAKCTHLIRKNGTVVSILACATVECLREWISDSRVNPATATTGVLPFLKSSAGGLVNYFGGAYNLRKKCAAKNGRFEHVIGCGNGEIMKCIADLLEKGKIKAVIDKVYSLDDSIDAIKYLETGRAGGKVVVTVIPSSTKK
eukprot:c21521_g1_i1.p1 GENE.c21521_g1_i1~~c21521_g1_i1.p1  ORF type:complete len:396 (-),score=180.68 c21521_g1_i1:48-1181(-)